MNYLSPKSRSAILDPIDSILKVEGLRTYFDAKPQQVKAVDGISFELAQGETLGIVGESGSGKSVTMLSILQLIEQPGKVISGSAIYCDHSSCTDLLTLSEKDIAKYRGAKIGMIYQQAISAFNPVHKIGKQLKEAVLVHDKKRGDIDKDLGALLSRVDLQDPQRVLDAYPHQLSGGQLQRCMIAMAIVNKPKILIADEPTTGLDVITQKAVLKLLQELKDELGMSMIFISHDLGVISEMADRTLVMKEGVVVEREKTADIFSAPKNLYTQALLSCRPSINKKSLRLPTYEVFLDGLDVRSENFKPLSYDKISSRRSSLRSQPIILEVSRLNKSYNIERGIFSKPQNQVNAVKDVSLELRQGEVLGVVGESGSGKSTLAMLLLNLERTDSGSIIFKDAVLSDLSNKELRPFRKKLQIIFQDVNGSLDPKMSVEDAISFALSIHNPKTNRENRKQKVIELLNQVGLSDKYLDRYPHELSGGEKQRVCIARAISVEPELLVCDECVSALDVSVQAQILNLLLDLRDKLGLSLIFISHDLSVINFMCDRVMVMRDGSIVEEGYPDEILKNPKVDYTRRLIDALPAGS